MAHNVFVGGPLPAAREGHLYLDTSQLNAQRNTHNSKHTNKQAEEGNKCKQ